MPDILFTDQAAFTHDVVTNTRSHRSLTQKVPHQVVKCNFNRGFHQREGMQCYEVVNLDEKGVYQLVTRATF